MILKPSPVSTEAFTYSAEDNLLTAEISTLGVPFGRVFDDACDEGVTLVSHRTGRKVVYSVVGEERADGDLLYWDLRPVAATTPGLPNVRIFND